MALPQEGLLTLQQVNIELSKEPEAHITMNDSDVRALAKRPVNESSISFDDLKGRTTGIAEYTIRRGHVDEDLIRMVNRELGDLSKVHIIFEDGITVVNQVFFDQSIANDITKGPYKMSGNTITDLSRFFRGCENMTEIGPELFYGLPKLKFIGSIFMNCPIKQYHSAMFKFNPELKELPPGVLDDNVIVPVDVFEGSAIEVISGNVRNESLDILNPIKNTIREINASIFQGQTIEPTMFADCINLFSVMKLSGNFEDRKGAFTTGFAGGAWLKVDTFKDLLKLNTISSLNVRGYDVGFLNNLPGLLNVHKIDAQQVPNVGRIFDTCPNLNNITKLFGNANVEYTNRTLVSVDEHIFDNCPNILICSEAFANCVNFTGKVPELWKRSNAPSIIHYDYAKGTINASNYIEIPTDWGGGELPKEQTFTSKEDFDNRIQNLIASGKMKEMSFTFDGDFTQEPNLIRFPVETTETPKMIKTTHTITVNSKEYYYLNIDSMFEDCVNLKYISPSLFSTSEYGKYQFIKTARKTFKNACVDGTEFPTGIFNVVEGLYDVSECFMNSKCTFGTSGPFKEKHHLMKCVSTFENSKITDNLAVFWQGIDGRFQGELEYPQRDLTRMYANTRLIAPYALWNGSFINVQGSIIYPVICDEMFAETDITNASMVVNSKAASKMESIKGMFKGSKVTKGKDLNTFSIAKYADYMYQNTPITSVGYLNSSTVISLEGIFDNCIQLQTATVDLTEENYSQRYPLNKNANWKFAFRNCNALTKAPNLWDIYKGESEDCFKGCVTASNYTEVPPVWGGPKPAEKVFTFNSKEEFDSNIQSIYTSNKINECILKFTYSPVQLTLPSYFTLCPKYIECDELDGTRLFSNTRIEVIPATIFDKVNRITSCKEMCSDMSKLKDVQFTLSQYKDKLVPDINIAGMFAYTYSYDGIQYNIPEDFFVGVSVSLEDNYYNGVFYKKNFGDNELNLSQTTITNNYKYNFCFYDKTCTINTITSKSIPICNSLENFFENITTSRIAANVLENINDLNKLPKLFDSIKGDNIIVEDFFSSLKPTIKSLINMGVYPELNLKYMFSQVNLASVDMSSLIEIFELYNANEQGKNKINIFAMFQYIYMPNKDFEIPILTKYDNIFSIKSGYCSGRIICRNYNEIPYAYGGPEQVYRFANKAEFDKMNNSTTRWYNSVIIFENGLENETIKFNNNNYSLPLIIYADKCISADYMFEKGNNGESNNSVTIPRYILYGMPNIETAIGAFQTITWRGNSNYVRSYTLTLNCNNNIFMNNFKLKNVSKMFYVKEGNVQGDGQSRQYVTRKISNLFKSYDYVVLPNVVDMSYMFACERFESYLNIDSNLSINYTFPNVETIEGLFSKSNIESTGTQLVDLNKCKDISYLYYGSIIDPSLPLYIQYATDLPLLENCKYAFYLNSNSRLKQLSIYDIITESNNLKDCSYCFNGIKYLKQGLLFKDPSQFQVLENCEHCFDGCTEYAKKIPEVWKYKPDIPHTGFATGCTNASNYNEIPDDWK